MKTLLVIIFLSLINPFSSAQQNIIVEQSECNERLKNIFELKERIISKEFKNDTLHIILGKRELCCAKFIANYSLEKDSLKIEYQNYADECFCTCFYELKFKIPINSLDVRAITFNGLQFEQSDQKFSIFTTKIDTLENGSILKSKFEDEELIHEIEKNDSILVVRNFYKGKMLNEKKLIKTKNISD